jgi:hypothetical protein
VGRALGRVPPEDGVSPLSDRAEWAVRVGSVEESVFSILQEIIYEYYYIPYMAIFGLRARIVCGRWVRAEAYDV